MYVYICIRVYVYTCTYIHVCSVYQFLSCRFLLFSGFPYSFKSVDRNNSASGMIRTNDPFVCVSPHQHVPHQFLRHFVWLLLSPLLLSSRHSCTTIASLLAYFFSLLPNFLSLCPTPSSLLAFVPHSPKRRPSTLASTPALTPALASGIALALAFAFIRFATS